ncbi:hypothetical protein HAX54_023867 [Datura stramonium]|uniref:1,3-beta-glucan synthase component FKS1-like domain-containing protein n=1 Tax=Datura stramonium TaxID=4076 RepID=A0ABS8RK02_DATST|nr:hypothetical protein [Datura stramonium]
MFPIREHIVHLLANEQTQARSPKNLNQYWMRLLYRSLDVVSKEKKLLFISLYFLIWGEAANIRFIPECLCYIFHHMGRELEELLRQQDAQPAKSCISENGVVISWIELYVLFMMPLRRRLETMRTASSTSFCFWRNYDDFNESRHCFKLSWPRRTNSSFLFLSQHPDQRTFLKPEAASLGEKLLLSTGLFSIFITVSIAFGCFFSCFFRNDHPCFHDARFDSKTLREVLSLGPTYVVMKFLESVLMLS